jgi:PAS domain S-box-containing protein
MGKAISQSQGRVFNLAIAASLLGLAGFLAILVTSLVNEHRNAEARAQVEAENLSRVLQEHALATVQKIDLLLRDVQGHMRPADMRAAHSPDSPRARELHILLKSRLENVPEASVLHVTNARGDHVYSSLDPVPRINIADRYHFTRQRSDPAAGLVISPPIKSRTTGKWAFVLSRRLNFEDGSFAGIVNIVLNLDYFEKFYQSLDLGTHGTVVLRDMELRLAARFPSSEKDMGKQIPGHHAAPYVGKGMKQGIYRARGQVDGTERLYSFRQVDDLPLVVFAGIAEQDYLAEWRRHLWFFGSSAVIFSVVVIGLILLSRRGMIEQQRGEDALRASEARLNQAQHIAHIGSWELDLATNALHWSDEIYRMFEIDREKFGASYEAFLNAIHPDDRDMVNQAYTDSVASRTPYDIVHRLLFADGRIKCVNERCETFYDAQGKPTRSIGTVQDITDHKRMEDELRGLNENLGRRVDEELAKNREKDHILIQQSRLAAMGEMIHNIAHQWRQPLSALSLIISNIKDDFDFGELDAATLDGAVITSRRLLDKMSSTIDDFRDFFRPDREPGEFNIGSAVEDALFIMDAALKNNRITVEKSFEPNLNAYGYANQFAQAVLNVIANAKEAIQMRKVPAGKIDIRLTCRETSAELAIQDNAGGIPADVLPRIFDPYFTTKEQGSGIGLYMSKMIIERNIHGKIKVINSGEGTLVTIAIPLLREEGKIA